MDNSIIFPEENMLMFYISFCKLLNGFDQKVRVYDYSIVIKRSESNRKKIEEIDIDAHVIEFVNFYRQLFNKTSFLVNIFFLN